MQGNFYTTELVIKARKVDALQEAEHTRMVRIAAEGSGQSRGLQRLPRDPEAIRLSRVTLPRLARFFAW